MPSVAGYHGRTYNELKQLCMRVCWDEKRNCYVDADTDVPVDDTDKARFNMYYYQCNAYATSRYTIISEPHKMTTEEWAEVCDNGGYNFGSRREGNDIVVYID